MAERHNKSLEQLAWIDLKEKANRIETTRIAIQRVAGTPTSQHRKNFTPDNPGEIGSRYETEPILEYTEYFHPDARKLNTITTTNIAGVIDINGNAVPAEVMLEWYEDRSFTVQVKVGEYSDQKNSKSPLQSNRVFPVSVVNQVFDQLCPPKTNLV